MIDVVERSNFVVVAKVLHKSILTTFQEKRKQELLFILIIYTKHILELIR